MEPHIGNVNNAHHSNTIPVDYYVQFISVKRKVLAQNPGQCLEVTNKQHLETDSQSEAAKTMSDSA